MACVVKRNGGAKDGPKVGERGEMLAEWEQSCFCLKKVKQKLIVEREKVCNHWKRLEKSG